MNICAGDGCEQAVEMMAYKPYCSQLCARAAGEEIRSLANAQHRLQALEEKVAEAVRGRLGGAPLSLERRIEWLIERAS